MSEGGRGHEQGEEKKKTHTLLCPRVFKKQIKRTSLHYSSFVGYFALGQNYIEERFFECGEIDEEWAAHRIAVEWLVKNTPKDMHVLSYFIRPDELRSYCHRAGMEVLDMTGIKPVFSTITWRMLRTGTVGEEFRFETSKSRLLSYLGFAKKRLS